MKFFNVRSSKKQEEEQILTKSQKFYQFVRDYIYIFAGFMLAFALLFRTVVVDGPSMNQTLANGDRLLLVSRVLYHTPKLGDVVVVSKDDFRNGECIVKRIIATEGQKVEIDVDEGTVRVDGELLQESYAWFNGANPYLEDISVTVGEGCVFVMGDNRNNSLDSRSPTIGQIDCREILGKVVFLLFPGTDDRTAKADYSRIGVVK